MHIRSLDIHLGTVEAGENVVVMAQVLFHPNKNCHWSYYDYVRLMKPCDD